MLYLRYFQTACFSFTREKDQGMRTAECWVNFLASNQEKSTGAGFLLSSSQTTVINHTAGTSQVNVNTDGFGYQCRFLFFDTHSGLCGKPWKKSHTFKQLSYKLSTKKYLIFKLKVFWMTRNIIVNSPKTFSKFPSWSCVLTQHQSYVVYFTVYLLSELTEPFPDVCCPSLKFHYIKITAASFTFFFFLLHLSSLLPLFLLHLTSDQNDEGASNDFRSIKYL